MTDAYRNVYGRCMCRVCRLLDSDHRLVEQAFRLIVRREWLR